MRNYRQLTKALRNLNYFEESEVFKEILSEIGFFALVHVKTHFFFLHNLRKKPLKFIIDLTRAIPNLS